MKSTLFQNTNREHYKRHAQVPLEKRITVSSNLADVVLEGFYDRQPSGDVKKRPSALCFPAAKELQAMERLVDYILAEDHVKGLSILRDPYDMPRDRDVFYPPGEGAIAFIQSLMTAEDYEAQFIPDIDGVSGVDIKYCEICELPFKDVSVRRSAKVCGKSCQRIYKTLWERRKRNGTEMLKGERERMDIEYPFYSPAEMKSIESRSERAYGGEDRITKMIAATAWKDQRGVKHGVRLVDKKGTYTWTSSRNRYKFNNWREEDEEQALITKQRRPEVVARYLRIKYRNRKYSTIHISAKGGKGNMSSA